MNLEWLRTAGLFLIGTSLWLAIIMAIQELIGWWLP